MKILYFGTVCNTESYNKILENCKIKPSVAALVFESALLEGFKANNADLEIHSFPMIPTFPGCKKLHFGGNTEKLPCGYDCRWLNTVNIPVIKQISRRLSANKAIKRWIKANKDDGVIFTYSIPPFLVKSIIKYARKYSVKTFALVADLLRDMYVNENQSSLSAKLKQCYINPALKLQGEYDGYIYLTEAMRAVVAPQKPYMVMEGIASTKKNDAATVETKKRAIMYAGMLHKKYGIINLVDAFVMANVPNAELWLFGEGNAVAEIKEYAEKDSRIKYFGSVAHDEILKYEKAASLLVNPRDPMEEFTKYSFPSKTIEYMLSGTPLLTTRLQGIPKEYFQYVFSSQDNTAQSLATAITKALSLSDEELCKMGAAARGFVLENKNAKAQTARIIKFINEVYNDSSY